jgi:hypothetical protein
MTDDGFNIGVLYRGNRPVYRAQAAPKAGGVAELEAGFRLQEPA